MAKKIDPLAKMRMRALPYGQDIRIMLIDFAGAPEYGLFSRYDKPLAVYPTWSPGEPQDLLIELAAYNVGEDEDICGNKSVRPEHRPVLGQKHRVVVHRLDECDDKHTLLKFITETQKTYPDCEIFVSGLTSFDHIFSWGLKACDFRPSCFSGYQILPRVTLPSGRTLIHSLHMQTSLFDPRYSDWFDLLGISQLEMMEALARGRKKMFPRFTLRSAQWARRNYSLVEPFALDRKTRRKESFSLSEGLISVPNDAFVLPATRRRVMRNIGMELGELDKFMCDTCILQNACTLYREGAVCGLKGSDGVGLSDAFGSRSADRIIDGLGELLKKQADRLEDAMAAEDAGDPSSDVTKQLNSLFGNAVKLAKLVDPALAGGSKVQVNIGVGAGGNAAIVASQDPRQITAQIVRELESQGIPRDKITGQMIAGYFESMGLGTTKKQAITAAKVVAEESAIVPKVIEGEAEAA
jgi:hypothetical protein